MLVGIDTDTEFYSTLVAE